MATSDENILYLNGKLDKIENKIDKVIDHTTSIDITLAKQHLVLEEHIKRTALLEKQVVPIQEHVNFINKLTKLVLAVVTAGAAIIEAWKYVK